jgi:hypothetical protein
MLTSALVSAALLFGVPSLWWALGKMLGSDVRFIDVDRRAELRRRRCG